MSTTSQLTTFNDLYTDLQNRVRISTGVAASENQAKRYINVALHDMHLGNEYKFPWAERASSLITHARYTTGTVTIAQGATALAGASTAWNTATGLGFNNMRAGGKVTFSGHVEPYEISSVSSDTAAVLTDSYVGSAISAGSYVYYEDEYALASDFFRPLDMSFFDSNREIQLIDKDRFYRAFPRNTQTGKPRWAMLIDKAPSGSTARIRRIVFAYPPDAVYKISYRYITKNLAVSSAGVQAESLSADADEPLVPLRYRHAILYHALCNWYRDKKDDSRADGVWAQYVDIMQRISGDVELGARTPKFMPNVSGYVGAARRPYRHRGRARGYTTGNAFDRME